MLCFVREEHSEAFWSAGIRRCSPRPDSGWQRADRNLLVSRVSQQHREQIRCSHLLWEHRQSSDTLWTGCGVIRSVLREKRGDSSLLHWGGGFSRALSLLRRGSPTGCELSFKVKREKSLNIAVKMTAIIKKTKKNKTEKVARKKKRGANKT